MARVRLEPVGQELRTEPGETLLEAAFRHGLNLAHGCREGQCSACKCRLLDGTVDLKPYSSFALSDEELETGHTLMCRAVPEGDVVLELLHYDEDNLRLEHPIAEVPATVVEVAELTREIVLLTLAVEGRLVWTPGQYVDLHAGEVRRSFSIANLPGESRLELVIRRYPEGQLSGLLGRHIVAGSSLRVTGPYGALRLHASDRPIVMVAGGSGIGPLLALLRQLAREGGRAPARVYFAAREPFLLDELHALGCELVLVRGRPIGELLEVEGEPDVYMCGPPSLLDAAEAALAARGVAPGRIFTDRFTTAAAASCAPGEAPGEREPAWFSPAGRRPRLYEEVTVDTQPSIHRHLRRGWPVSFADGRGTWSEDSTALRCIDWYAFRDPGELWERSFYARSSAAERRLEAAVSAARTDRLLEGIDPAWLGFLAEGLQVPAFVDHGVWFALATAARAALSDTVATCMCLQAAMKQRAAQAVVVYAMDLEPLLGRSLSVAAARRAFLTDPDWQPARRYVERLGATADWGEVLFATNLCLEPWLGTLIRRELLSRAAAGHGDSVTPALAQSASGEWGWTREWTAALARLLLADAAHGLHNRGVLERWVADWLPRAEEAAVALAPLLSSLGVDTARAKRGAREESERMMREAGLGGEPGLAGEPGPERGAALLRGPGASGGGSEGERVGIVMARSAEGDAVARLLSGREGISVIEQPSFWDIRAAGRLVIDYRELAAVLGYGIDAYSIQHEMSTHYGRLVATDEALMLFSDPAEALEHLLS